MSYMEARAEMPGENNSPVPIPRAQRVADRVHLRLAFLPGLEPATRRSADRRVTDRATREGFSRTVNFTSCFLVLNGPCAILITSSGIGNFLNSSSVS